jgi:hypothetical protein
MAVVSQLMTLSDDKTLPPMCFDVIGYLNVVQMLTCLEVVTTRRGYFRVRLDECGGQ